MNECVVPVLPYNKTFQKFSGLKQPFHFLSNFRGEKFIEGLVVKFFFDRWWSAGARGCFRFLLKMAALFVFLCLRALCVLSLPTPQLSLPLTPQGVSCFREIFMGLVLPPSWQLHVCYTSGQFSSKRTYIKTSVPDSQGPDLWDWLWSCYRLPGHDFFCHYVRQVNQKPGLVSAERELQCIYQWKD